MRLRLAATALAVLTLGLAPAALAEVPNPKVSGPIPARVQPGDKSHDYPWMATIHPIAQAGYVEEEFFFEGTARRFNTQGDNAMDGKLVDGGHAYRTRMIVRRPKDMKKFNGVVLAEWQNVTAGYDLDAMWGGSYEHIMRSGYVWVGISAQRVGVNREPNGLKVWSPVRYGALDVTDNGAVTDDALSYDIFAQGMEAVRDPQGVNVLGGAIPKTIIAMGASQSAGRLGTYINALHKELGTPVSAYLLMIGGARVRDDLNVPVFKLLSETDVPGQVRSRQPDTDKFRHWEVTGASHSSRRTSMNAGPLTKRDHVERAAAVCTYPTYPRVPMNYAMAAVYDHMTAWVQKGTLPPIAPRMEVEVSAPPPVAAAPADPAAPPRPAAAVIKRDARGNALGGIRMAEVDPAIALNSGANGGSGFCNLYGRFEPFDDATLASLYPNHKAYTDAANKRIADNLKAGYIVDADAKQSRTRAEQSIIGRGLKCAEACHNAQDLLNSAYFYLGASDQLNNLTTRLANVVRTVGEGKNAKAKADLNKAIKDLRNMQTNGKLSQSTVDELAAGADKVLAALK